MGFHWTRQQKKVIELRNRNILVSAAAGSGKTAVLVERILTRIARDENPTDIDKLLIVTFTNAAAAEMRERIRDALEQELELYPENEHLQKQITLIHHAQITTIDSFCLSVIRNYFHTIDLEPNFRVADEGELALLRGDVLDEVLEELYEEKSDSFVAFLESYSNAKSDKAIRDMVYDLYSFSQSNPWPVEWIDSCLEAYDVATFEEMSWTLDFIESMKMTFVDLKTFMEQALNLCRHPDGPAMYEPAILDDMMWLEELTGISSFERMYEKINEFSSSFAKLAAARKFDGDVEIKDMVKAMRDDMKKAIKDIKEKYFYKEPDLMLADMKKTAPFVETLIQITKTFMNRLEEEKKKKSILDFSDMEHLALKILIDETTKEPTQAADDFARQFTEIMIDEYQDSNLVQETILTAISKMRFGEYNLFMVGDVKQSIYRFRLARPELFMEKYNTYVVEENQDSANLDNGMPEECEKTEIKTQRIDLHQNFRSRSEVLSSVNDIFYKIMQKDLGNIVYDDNAALHPGASFLELPSMQSAMEVVVVTNSAQGEAEKEEDADSQVYDKPELEAYYIAQKIKTMVTDTMVTDKKTGQLKKAEYKDIVILLRSVSVYADIFVSILMQEGIPAFTLSKTGYFSTIEIQTILNVLRVLDNPMQDIPLTAVLRSYFCGLSGEELAKIRIWGEALCATKNESATVYSFYECVFSLWEMELAKIKEIIELKEQEIRLVEKIKQFHGMLLDFRSRISYTPVHELLMQILEESGYLKHIWALPAGEQKHANVQMLIERAIDYENTSYKGLFHFVQYIERLQKYDVDYGEADILSENANAVSIMSIHKSKGLEFPIVFASGMGKSFNMQDTKGKMVLHPDYGMGMDFVDANKRTKTPTLYKRVLAKKLNEETKGEELRILYVALTRAKEKLILTGYLKDAPKKLMDYKVKANEKSELSYLTRSKATSYWDLILPAVYSYSNSEENPRYPIQIYEKMDSKTNEIADQIKEALKKEQFKQYVKQAQPQILEAIDQKMKYQYPFENEMNIKTKMSVSELKSRAYLEEILEDEIVEKAEFIKETAGEKEAYVPDFMEIESEEKKGARRGSAVHLFMQCFPFEQYQEITKDGKETKKRILEWVNWVKDDLRKKHKLDDETYDLIEPLWIVDFLSTPLAKRMINAAQEDKLQKEKAFVLGIPAKEIEDCSSDELVLVQGIVDAFLIENDEITIMDYKTDRLWKEEEFLLRYKEQLELYAKALHLATGLPVKEKIIYSFAMKKEIQV